MLLRYVTSFCCNEPILPRFVKILCYTVQIGEPFHILPKRGGGAMQTHRIMVQLEISSYKQLGGANQIPTFLHAHYRLKVEQKT